MAEEAVILLALVGKEIFRRQEDIVNKVVGFGMGLPHRGHLSPGGGDGSLELIDLAIGLVQPLQRRRGRNIRFAGDDGRKDPHGIHNP